MPDKPWSELSIDLLDVPGEHHLLVVVDYYSRWPEVTFMKKTDAENVIRCLEKMFRTHGLPDTIRTDNGPPFQSEKFSTFLSNMGIDHKKGIPLSPESNGEVERTNSTILKAVRIAHVQSKDWMRTVEEFLFDYRTTPHTVTGQTPAKSLMGRELRSRIPKISRAPPESEQQ